MAKDTILGKGWNITFGTLEKNDQHVSIELQDGTQSTAVRDSLSGSNYITKDFWKLSMPLGGTPILQLSDGTKITFGRSGIAGDPLYYATKIQKNNNVVDITYIQNGAIANAVKTVTYKTSGTSKNITFNYKAGSNHLQSISWGSSTDLKYLVFTYSNDDQTLASVTMPEGDHWDYTYELKTVAMRYNFLVKTVTTPTGGVYSYEFDTFYKGCGMASKIQGGVSEKSVNDGLTSGTWTYNYQSDINQDADITTITEPLGRKSVYYFYGLGSQYNQTCYKYGLMRSKTMIDGDLSESTTYNWSKLSGPISTIGYSAVCACNDTYTYVPVLDTEITTRDGTTYRTDYSDYDAYGNPGKIVETGSNTRTTTTAYWNDISRNMVKGKPKQVDIMGDTGFPGVFSTSYDYHTADEATFGKIKKVTKYGIATQYVFDAQGNLDAVTDANNQTTYYDWSNGAVSSIINPEYTISRETNWDGTIASETNGRGFTTLYTYDNNMRLLSTTPPLGNPTIITYLYDVDYYLEGKSETRGAFVKTTSFDGLGREISIWDSVGIMATTFYKANGLKESTATNIGDTVLFDNLERIKNITHQDNSVITYQYANNAEIHIYDEVNNQTHQKFSYFGSPEEHHLTYLRDALNTVTEYSYNILGSLLTTTTSGLTRSFTYYPTNQLQTETHPESGTTTYTRYPTGHLMQKSENGQTITYTYDAINRLKTATSGSFFQKFWYDKSDNITQMTSYGVDIVQNHDAANRLTSKDSTINGQKNRISYTYDANDNITGITYPSGLLVNYSYNGLNQITRVSGFGAELSGIEYYTAASAPRTGLLKSYTRSNGQKVSFAWDKRRRMYSNGHPQLALNYRYDARGNLTQLLRPGKGQSFTYDGINRVTTANGPWGSGVFGYDSLDNRTLKTLGSKTTYYIYSNNKLTEQTGKTYGYSGANINRIGDYTFSYDPFDNVQTSNNGSIVAGQYLYDAQNDRAYKKSGSTTTLYHYGQSGNVLSELDQSGSGVMDYIYLNNMLVARSSGKPKAVVAPWLMLLLDGK